MSKYKAGDKLIIEIENISNLNVTTLGAPSQIEFYKLKGFPYLISKEIIESIQKYVPKKQIIDRYAYKKGLKDAWEAARKIGCTPSDGGFTVDELQKIFGSGISFHIVKKFEVEEAVKKIKEYEEKINVGDVLEHKKWKIRVVVTKVKESSFNSINISNLEFVKGVISDNWEKTRYNIDLGEILRAGCDQDAD